jgi:hypothetical protein
MAGFQFPWCIYAEQQSKAARCGRMTDRSWGIENGLTNFLTAVESGGLPNNEAEFERGVERAVATGSWVERNHARLLRKYVQPGPDQTEDRMLDHIRLAELRESVNAAEWTLLMAVAAGVAYHEIAGMTAGAARTRVARLRARLRPIAGQERPKYASESSRL